ncbi:MAG: hypothetical protein N7Q72_06860, partial [Spiroplasma sp. Tabriz.8]|nr:hypothetical protein [Spiroplasma sp. Tabriz.8]
MGWIRCVPCLYSGALPVSYLAHYIYIYIYIYIYTHIHFCDINYCMVGRYLRILIFSCITCNVRC